MAPRGKVLLAEDDARERKALESALKVAGFFVLGVGGATEAMAALEGQAFDVLLADIKAAEAEEETGDG